MSEVIIPTVGREVHYFPNGADEHCSANNAEVVPAKVVQVFGIALNLAVTCMNPDAPVVLRSSVAHFSSIAVDAEGKVKEGKAYWDWPARQ